MILPSLTNLLLGKQYIGIEHFSLNNQEMIAVLLIEKKKEELLIAKKDKVTYEEMLPEKWDKSLPFFIVVNTNQVIQKELAATDATDEKLLHKAFPNTNWEEFYFEIWRLKTKSIIAISRKIYVDALLSNYRKQGVSIAGICLGVCSVAELINYSEKNEFHTNHQIVSLAEENQTITMVVTDLDIACEINGLAIRNSHVLAFAGILRLLLNGTTNTGNLIDYSHQLYEDYNQKSFFSKGLKIMVGVLLAILLLNFFAFTHYYKLAEETSESLSLSESSVEEMNITKQHIKTKEQKVKNVVATTASQSSLVINEITKRIPQSVLLTELVYHPLEKKIKTEESIVAQEKIVTVSGTTLDNATFTHWIEAIEQLKWIDQVVITRFGKNELNETEFSIKLTLK